MLSEDFDFDEIGRWSEIKLEIINQYISAYSTILANQRMKYYYIDGFAGAGIHKSKTTGEIVEGSPLIALKIKPPFDGYYLTEADSQKSIFLSRILQDYANVQVINDDCNDALPEKIYPLIRYEDYRRAFCLLDPYGLELKWNTILKAAETKTIEVLINFPIMSINRNPARRDRKKVTEKNIEKMNEFWGDNSWRDTLYPEVEDDLFGYEKKASNEQIVDAFTKRLRQVAGYKYVSNTISMKNSKGGIVYYLIFASHNITGKNIMNDIFKNIRKKYGS